MRDPISQLKRLPWLLLLQATLLTVLVAVVLEGLLFVIRGTVPAIAPLFQVLFSDDLLGLFVRLSLTAGFGALAVVWLERLTRSPITTGYLWALIPCLFLAIALVNAFGLLPFGLIGLNEVQLLGLIVGIFWKGRPYWRSFRRW